MSNTMHPKNAIIKDADGQIYSVVDILQGNTTALPDDTNNGMHPQNAIVMDADGTLHSLVDLLAGAGGGGGPVDPTSILDDENVLTNKTYSSSKIEERLNEIVVESSGITVDSNTSDIVNFKFAEVDNIDTVLQIPDFKAPFPSTNFDIANKDFTIIFDVRNMNAPTTQGASTSTLAKTIDDNLFFRLTKHGEGFRFTVRYNNNINHFSTLADPQPTCIGYRRLGNTISVFVNTQWSDSINFEADPAYLTDPNWANLIIGDATAQFTGSAKVYAFHRDVSNEEILNLLSNTQDVPNQIGTLQTITDNAVTGEYTFKAPINDITPSKQNIYSSSKVQQELDKLSGLVTVDNTQHDSFNFKFVEKFPADLTLNVKDWTHPYQQYSVDIRNKDFAMIFDVRNMQTVQTQTAAQSTLAQIGTDINQAILRLQRQVNAHRYIIRSLNASNHQITVSGVEPQSIGFGRRGNEYFLFINGSWRTEALTLDAGFNGMDTWATLTAGVTGVTDIGFTGTANIFAFEKFPTNEEVVAVLGAYDISDEIIMLETIDESQVVGEYTFKPPINDALASTTHLYSSSKVESLIRESAGASLDDENINTTSAYSSSKVEELFDTNITFTNEGW